MTDSLQNGKPYFSHTGDSRQYSKSVIRENSRVRHLTVGSGAHNEKKGSRTKIPLFEDELFKKAQSEPYVSDIVVPHTLKMTKLDMLLIANILCGRLKNGSGRILGLLTHIAYCL